MKALAEKYGCNAIAIQCWNTLQDEIHIMPCAANSLLNEEDIPVVCETDIHGAISQLIAEAASMNERRVMFSDWTVRHPDNDNGELLQHCGPWPISVAKEKPTICVPVVMADSEDYDVAVIACGEMVRPAIEAAQALKSDGISAAVVDMYCVKPVDREAVLRVASKASLIVTVEEHAPFGGLGSMVSQIVAAECPKRVINLALPDVPVITGNSQEVFDTYGLNAEGIANTVRAAIR